MKKVKAAAKTISLKCYHPAYLDQLKRYHLSEKDQEFTGMPVESLGICSKNKNRYSAIIDCNGLAAGYFMLHDGFGIKKYTDNENAILLRTYSVDSRYRGMGIAKQSLKLLPGFVRQHFPHISEIVLAVNHRNTAAQQLYKQVDLRIQE